MHICIDGDACDFAAILENRLKLFSFGIEMHLHKYRSRIFLFLLLLIRDFRDIYLFLFLNALFPSWILCLLSCLRHFQLYL